jgi:hypothetical protein
MEPSMADKTTFTKEEWTLLMESPTIAGMAITAADPSGLWGLMKESLAAGGALAEAATGAGTNTLVKSVATDFATTEGRNAVSTDLQRSSASLGSPNLEYVRRPICRLAAAEAC